VLFSNNTQGFAKEGRRGGGLVEKITSESAKQLAGFPGGERNKGQKRVAKRAGHCNVKKQKGLKNGPVNSW